jgi:hypothetical protein
MVINGEMKKNKNADGETFLQILFGVIAILTIKSLFEHDNSRILSQKGSQMLSDDKKMEELDRKLRKMESSKESEITI